MDLKFSLRQDMIPKFVSTIHSFHAMQSFGVLRACLSLKPNSPKDLPGIVTIKI